MSPEKLLLISDVHANLHALEAVLSDISRRGLGAAPLCFLGDAVNMGPFPAEVVRLLSSLKPAFRVKGNHDRYASSEPNRTGPGWNGTFAARKGLTTPLGPRRRWTSKRKPGLPARRCGSLSNWAGPLSSVFTPHRTAMNDLSNLRAKP